MDDLARLHARMDSLTELRGLFSAMQALAASQVQAAQSALGSIRLYTTTIERAIGDAITLQQFNNHLAAAVEPVARSVLVVVCSEHGFSGAFNRLLLERARSVAEPAEHIVVVGQRGASVAGEHMIIPAWTLPMATHVDGLLKTARRLASWLADCTAVRAVFGRYRGGSQFDVEVRQLLPLAPETLAPGPDLTAPLYQLAPALLLHRLVGEFLLAELMLALTESFASENAARLRIMQAAEHNIDDKLEGLTRRTQQLRQDAITSELLEVVAGAEAVIGDNAKGGG
jgi:F-type H+-transporting ATPase subunit gamma